MEGVDRADWSGLKSLMGGGKDENDDKYILFFRSLIQGWDWGRVGILR